MSQLLAHVLPRPLAARLPAVPRWLRITLIVVAALYASYLIAANVILRTRLLRTWVNDDHSDIVLVDYSSAWSVWPGHVHVNDLTLRFQDDNVQFFLSVEKATTNVDLLALTRRTFRSTHTEATGASYFMRHKLQDPRGNEARIAAYPPIAGFENTLVRKPKKPEPITDGRYDLWTVEMTNVSASIREFWVLEYHYEGPGSVAGAFHLEPLRELWLTPTFMITDGGTLSIGNREIVKNTHIRFEVRVDDFDVSGPVGLEVMRHIDAQLALRGEVVSIEPFGATYIDPARHMKLERGQGPLDMAVHMDHALLLGGETKIDWRSNDVRVTTPVGVFEGDVKFLTKVDGVREDGILVTDVTLGSLVFSPKDRAVVANDVALGVRFDHADVSRDFDVSSLTAHVGQAKAPDLSKLQPLFPDDVVLEGGGASLSGRFGYHGGALDGRADVALDRARLKTGAFSANASGRVWGSVKSANVDQLVTFPDVGADLQTVGIHLDGQAADDLWLKLAFVGATRRADVAETKIQLTAGPGDRILRFGAGAAGIPKEAADLASGRELTATLRLKKTKDETSLTVDDARDGKLEAKGRLAKAAESKLRGAFLIELGPLSAGVLVDHGKASVRPMVGHAWLDQN